MSIYDSILVAVDGSDPSDTAIRQAVTLATAFDATVSGVHAVEEHSLSLASESPEEPVQPDEQAQQAIEELESLAADAGVDCRTTVERGAAHEVVGTFADQFDADLVAMGTHGRTGLQRIMLGSVAERTLRTSDVPVLTTRALEGPAAFDSILVPTDGSDCAGRAVDHALDVAPRFDATVHAVSVIDIPSLSAYGTGIATPAVIEDLEEDHRQLVESVAERAEGRDLETETAVPKGSPPRILREYVADHDIDLVAMGTHGRSGLERHLLGSVTERLVRTSEAPVMAVPP